MTDLAPIVDQTATELIKKRGGMHSAKYVVYRKSDNKFLEAFDTLWQARLFIGKELKAA